MTWRARLELRARHDGGRCTVHSEHEGPLRVLKALYPEGLAVAHQVIVHPPGGIVGGDQLEVTVALQPQAHVVITTPGATRFYRTDDGRDAAQMVQATVGRDARLEWLPLETIVHSGCRAQNQVVFELDDGAEMIGWDTVALGLPAAGEAFSSGRFTQHVQWPGHWIERGVVDGGDTRLLQSPLGLNGHSAWLTMWFAAHDTLDATRIESLLDDAREVAATQAKTGLPIAGATCLHRRVVVLRALADRTEPLMALAQAVRGRWRTTAWALPDTRPRVWCT